MKEEGIGLYGLILATLAGLLGFGIYSLIKTPLAEPLLLSLLIGITIGSILPPHTELKRGLEIATRVFLPIGLVFYSANNLNFVKVSQFHTRMLILLLTVMVVYFLSIIITGRLLNQRRQITYLIANGSAICGASAIVITSPAVDAKPDDVSVSLLSVFITAMTALFIIFPFIATTSGMTDRTYGILSGMVLQFTGLIKIAVGTIPYLERVMSGKGLLSFTLSIKAVRYLGLLVSVPLFTSMLKGRFYLPWVLWLFLIPGVVGTWAYQHVESFYSNVMIPVIHPLHTVSWSIVMASIGLNADIRQLLSNNGAKALMMAFVGFFSATVTFFAGFYFLSIFNL